MSFEDLAFLFLPAGVDRTANVIETDDRWRPLPTPAENEDVVLWGRGATRSGTGMATSARSAIARERVLRSIRHRAFRDVIARVHRLPPPRLSGSRVRERLRAALLGGALVELWSGPPSRRVIDVVAEEAGASQPVVRFRPGSGGSALIQVTRNQGQLGLLRVGRSNGPADPHRATQALETLEPFGLRQIPRLLGRGTAAGASWSTETSLPGRRPTRISRSVAAEVVALCTALPRSGDPATAHEQDLASIAETFPRWATVLSHVAHEIRQVAQAVPSVLRHGDLWAGNVLVQRGRLTGLVDWDAWHPAALPGVDVLHLVATGEEIGARRSLGEVWLGQPWTGELFHSLTTEYWAALRIVPNEGFLRTLGWAWWASSVAASIRRIPRLARESRWVGANVDLVLGAQ